MKKLIVMLLALAMVLCLTACGAEEENNADLVITRAAKDDVEETQGAAESEAPVAAGGVFAFAVNGVELIPGEPFDAAALGTAASVFQVPSCAIDGTDNVYNYETFEVTAFDDGSGEVIYSVLFIDPNLTTAEGLALGDSAAKAVELYGEDYTEEGTARIYTRNNTQLYLILQNDAIISIEYRLAV